MCIIGFNIEFGYIVGEGPLNCSQAAGATSILYKAWRDTESADVGPSNLLSFDRTERVKKKMEIEMETKMERTREAYEKYHTQGEQ